MPWHDLVDLWFGPQPVGEPEQVVGRLFRHNEMVTDDWTDGDVQVLVVEQQGTWLWGRAADGRFVERENARDRPWLPTGEDEEQFWLHHAAFEALLAMPAARCGQIADRTLLNRLEGFSEPLPCGTWRWIGAQQVRFRQACVITQMVHEDGVVEVMAGAHTERELAWIDSLGIAWDVYDTRVGQA